MSLSHPEVYKEKQWEKELQRINRALRLVSQTNKALTHASDVVTWLNHVCRTAVDVGGYRMAWVGFAEQDEKKSVRPVAYAGFESGYLKTANITWSDEPRGRGPVGTAIRTGEFFITHNIPEDPAFDPWREAAISRGFHSVVALPLKNKGRTFGCLSMYADEVDAFGTKEIEILKELAEDLAFGLTVVLQARAEGQCYVEALKESQHKLEQAQRVAHVGHWERDLTTNRIKWSDEIYRIFGLEPQVRTLLLEDWLGFLHPEDRMRIAKAISETERGLRRYNVEYRIIHPDGEVRFVQSQADVSRDDSGRPRRVFGTLQDITDRRRALNALSESEERFRQVTESIDEVFWLSDIARTRTFYISPAVRA